MNSVSNLIQQSNPYSQYVNQLVQLESQEKIQLQDQKSNVSNQKSALGDVSSVISSFTSKVDELSSGTQNNFNPLKATSSNSEVVRVDSTSGLKDPGNYDITVNRTASKDIMLSNVKDGAATTLAGQGAGSVDITIGDKTETISVSATNADGTDKTNKQILESFSTAVNNKLDAEADSNVLQIDNNGNVQLSIKSAKTGSAEAISFSNASGVLGQVTGNMAHNTDTTKLDAKFSVDGVSFTRGQNSVNDAISGMTFTLLNGSGNQEQISVSKDLEQARTNIDEFISSFNKMNDKIRGQTFIDGETGEQGPLNDMRSIRNLTISLRQTALRDRASAGSGELDNLSQIGIGFENDGTMKIEDSDLLDKALNENPEEVNKLFTADDSPVTAMKERAKTYTESDGIISSLESGLDQKIDFLDNRIESENEYLEKYEERQRQRFNELYQLQQQSQRQLNRVSSQQSQLMTG